MQKHDQGGIDGLASDIRFVDGGHSLGAGALAEELYALGYRRYTDADWEYAVRQHDGHVWEVDLDDEPWMRSTAFRDASEIRGGHVVRRVTAGEWESAETSEATVTVSSDG